MTAIIAASVLTLTFAVFLDTFYATVINRSIYSSITFRFMGRLFGSRKVSKSIDDEESTEQDNEVSAFKRQSNDRVINNVEHLDSLVKTLALHKKLGHTKSYEAGRTLMANILEMLERMSVAYASTDELPADIRAALMKYGEIVKHVNTLYGEEVYLDIQADSSSWSERGDKEAGEKKLLEIVSSVTKLSESVKQDIVTFNNTKTLGIQASLDALEHFNFTHDNHVENIFPGTAEHTVGAVSEETMEAVSSIEEKLERKDHTLNDFTTVASPEAQNEITKNSTTRNNSVSH